jgi:hypothetical protein
MSAMDISRDELRRQLRDADRANDQAVAAQRRMLARVFDGDDELSGEQKADLLLGGLARRRFLAIGGIGVATAAVLAACGGKGTTEAVPQEGLAPSTTGLPTRNYSDVVLLRTGASLERSVVAAYDAAIALLDGDVRNTARMFQAHHQAHAAAFDLQTTKAGGEAFSGSNPVVDDKVIKPALALVKNPAAALKLAHALENVAAHTYQTLVPLMSLPALRASLMSVGSVEARHAAILANVLGGLSYPGVPATPAVGAAPTTAAATTTTVAGEIAGPLIYVVPGSFEPVAATQVALGAKLVSIDPLGPNSYSY